MNPDEPYRNRELDQIFDDIQKTLIRIETQTTRTNGRVSSLEGWRQYIVGAVSVLVIVVVPVLGVLAWQVVQNKSQLAGVDVQLTELELKP